MTTPRALAGVALAAAALILPSAAGAAAVEDVSGAVVRWLDKITGQTVDLDLTRGQVKTQGRLSILLSDCRYPAADPAANAYAHLTIRDAAQASAPVFDGWMIADSPALSAMDHPRYDVWILRCSRS